MPHQAGFYEVDMEKFIRLSGLETSPGKGRTGVVPLSGPSIWRLAREGKFPRPYKLSDGITAWKLSEIEAWMKARCDARDEVAA